MQETLMPLKTFLKSENLKGLRKYFSVAVPLRNKTDGTILHVKTTQAEAIWMNETYNVPYKVDILTTEVVFSMNV